MFIAAKELIGNISKLPGAAMKNIQFIKIHEIGEDHDPSSVGSAGQIFQSLFK